MTLFNGATEDNGQIQPEGGDMRILFAQFILRAHTIPAPGFPKAEHVEIIAPIRYL